MLFHVSCVYLVLRLRRGDSPLTRLSVALETITCYYCLPIGDLMSKNLRKKLLQDAHVISRSLLAEGLCFHFEVVDGKTEAVNLSCWLVVWNMFYFPFHIWEWKIIPTDFHCIILEGFPMVSNQPPTR